MLSVHPLTHPVPPLLSKHPMISYHLTLGVIGDLGQVPFTIHKQLPINTPSEVPSIMTPKPTNTTL